jgi:serine/threonine-protein kinase
VANRKLGKYEIIERLGRGGMAEVYRAYHTSLDRYVAIKVLHAFLADDPEFKSRFEKEAQNVAKLKQAHIVQVYDFEYDAAGESYYMVMELIEGPTLKGAISRPG